MPDKELPAVAARYDGPPPPRTWADRDPAAAARLARARTELKQLAEDNQVPVENLLTPDFVRRLLWEPPDGDDLSVAVRERLLELGARSWQIDMTLRAVRRRDRGAPAAAGGAAATDPARGPTGLGVRSPTRPGTARRWRC